ncbi:hypothetical protein ACFL2R_03050 [Patescibacteria group bacterium]
MDYRKIVRNMIITCVVLIGMSVVLASPEVFGLCPKGDLSCVRGFIHKFDEVIQTVFYFAFAIGIVSLGLYFTGQKSFNIWKKFSMIYLPVALILVLMSPSVNMQFIGVDRELVTLWLAGIFFVISLIIIFTKREKHSPLDLDEC